MATPTPADQFKDIDIIFAGGGTAACVAAGRLAKANPDLKILLVESGPNNFNNPAVVNPALYLSHLVPGGTTIWDYKANASTFLNGREAHVQTGGILGGGGSINFMAYYRPSAVDYDSWETKGWSAQDMIPLARKLETYHPRADGLSLDTHGSGGPVNIGDGGFRGASYESAFESLRTTGTHKEITDLQDFESVGGFTKMARYVGQDGKRQDPAHRYIHPLLLDGQHPNLHILVETKIIRVIFDKSTPPRAIGLEYASNQAAPTNSTPSSPCKPSTNIIKAAKLVVISAGALGTPLILERSGVGNPSILKSAGIKLISSVPGVGENYQDHLLMLYPYKSSLSPNETLDGIWSGRKNVTEAIIAKDPQLGWNAIDIGFKLRPTPKELSQFDPAFQAHYNTHFVPFPTRPLSIGGLINGFLGDPSSVAPGQYFTMGAWTAYSLSTGHIHVTNASDLTNGYEFDTGFLSHEGDIKTHLWIYKTQREIARRLPYYRGELESDHPKFGACSEAALNQDVVGEKVVGDIVYSAEDDEAIEDHVRNVVATMWHSLGTSSMKPWDKGGVVDANLNVYGTQGLKVADLSIAPENVGANTYNTALTIGEKAAVIIAADLHLKL